MTTLNTIIEEEKKEFDKRFMQDGELLTAFDGKDDASDIKSHLTTAMQRAYEAGEKKGLEEERERIWREANKLPIQEGRADLISLLDFQNVLYHSELDQEKV